LGEGKSHGPHPLYLPPFGRGTCVGPNFSSASQSSEWRANSG
jgi:hypothetical protein